MSFKTTTTERYLGCASVLESADAVDVLNFRLKALVLGPALVGWLGAQANRVDADDDVADTPQNRRHARYAGLCFAAFGVLNGAFCVGRRQFLGYVRGVGLVLCWSDRM